MLRKDVLLRYYELLEINISALVRGELYTESTAVYRRANYTRAANSNRTAVLRSNQMLLIFLHDDRAWRPRREGNFTAGSTAIAGMAANHGDLVHIHLDLGAIGSGAFHPTGH